jgi:pentapeptide MXKDX repeat protein
MNPPVVSHRICGRTVTDEPDRGDDTRSAASHAHGHTTGKHEILARFLVHGTRCQRLHYCDVDQPTEEVTMKKIVFAVCCATLMGIGTAAAQTTGPASQDSMKQNDTMSKGSSTSQNEMSKGKMAKSKTSKHKTVGMSKNSKMKSDSMQKNEMSK